MVFSSTRIGRSAVPLSWSADITQSLECRPTELAVEPSAYAWLREFGCCLLRRDECVSNSSDLAYLTRAEYTAAIIYSWVVPDLVVMTEGGSFIRQVSGKGAHHEESTSMYRMFHVATHYSQVLVAMYCPRNQRILNE